MPTWKNILSKRRSQIWPIHRCRAPRRPRRDRAADPHWTGRCRRRIGGLHQLRLRELSRRQRSRWRINPNAGWHDPPLGGAAFDAQFPTASPSDVITSGSVIGRNPITSMPHWGGIIPQEQLDQLVAYIRTLPGALLDPAARAPIGHASGRRGAPRGPPQRICACPGIGNAGPRQRPDTGRSHSRNIPRVAADESGVGTRAPRSAPESGVPMRPRTVIPLPIKGPP